MTSPCSFSDLELMKVFKDRMWGKQKGAQFFLRTEFVVVYRNLERAGLVTLQDSGV